MTTVAPITEMKIEKNLLIKNRCMASTRSSLTVLETTQLKRIRGAACRTPYDANCAEERGQAPLLRLGQPNYFTGMMCCGLPQKPDAVEREFQDSTVLGLPATPRGGWTMPL